MSLSESFVKAIHVLNVLQLFPALFYKERLYVFSTSNTTQKLTLCDIPFEGISSLPQRNLHPKGSQNTVS